jgi:hypothetical protein
LAGRQLSERRAALDRLAGAGRHQAAPHHRWVSQPVDQPRLLNFPRRGMGAQFGASRCPSRMGQRSATPGVSACLRPEELTLAEAVEGDRLG